MRKCLLFLSFCCSTYFVYSQQLHFMSQYLQHNSMLNPGAAGIANQNMIGVAYRSQWSSFPGNPRTYMVYGDANLEKYKAGLGGYVYRDETGPTSRTGLQLAFSKHIISKDEKQRLGLGIELRGLQYALDKGKVLTALGNDPALGGASSKFAIDAGAGIYYTDGKLSVGAAVSQLIQSKLELANVPNAKLSGKLYRHYNFNANYKIQTGDDIFLIPNAFVRVVQNAPTEFEAGMKLDYQDRIWFAFIYKLNQLYSIQTGLKIADKVNISYSYDAYNTPISVYDGSSGAHELGVRFDIGKK